MPAKRSSSTPKGARPTGSTLKSWYGWPGSTPKLLAPVEHRGQSSQAHLALIRSREALVRTRSRLVNHVRFTVKPFGHRLPKCSAQGFHKRVAGRISQFLEPSLGPILQTIG
jgi:transposase